MILTVEGLTFDELKQEGVHSIVSGSFRDISAFALRQRKTRKTCVETPSQDLPVTYRHLSSSSANRRIWDIIFKK
jgi:hypothetical protein